VSGGTLAVENPAKRQPIAEIPRGGAADVDHAVQAAARAFPGWSKAASRSGRNVTVNLNTPLRTR
jgi:betaine-aldehyde dehydrogenase